MSKSVFIGQTDRKPKAIENRESNRSVVCLDNYQIKYQFKDLVCITDPSKSHKSTLRYIPCDSKRWIVDDLKE